MYGFFAAEWVVGLKNLRYLNLAFNRMEGEIPDVDGWMQWDHLEILELNNNNFSGILPTKWDHLYNLQFINVANNSLGDAKPMPVYYGM